MCYFYYKIKFLFFLLNYILKFVNDERKIIIFSYFFGYFCFFAIAR